METDTITMEEVKNEMIDRIGIYGAVGIYDLNLGVDNSDVIQYLSRGGRNPHEVFGEVARELGYPEIRLSEALRSTYAEEFSKIGKILRVAMLRDATDYPDKYVEQDGGIYYADADGLKRYILDTFPLPAWIPLF